MGAVVASGRKSGKKAGKYRRSGGKRGHVGERLAAEAPTDGDPASSSPTRPHIPVLLPQVLELLSPSTMVRVVDGTLGAGGHATAWLEAHPEGSLLGMDRDPRALELAKAHLERFGGRFRGYLGAFSTIQGAITDVGWPTIDGLLLDIGVSSMQLDQAGYGMSFQTEAPLDMRMGTDGATAAELMASLSEAELADVIYQFGEERLSRRIASRIKSAIDDGEMNTTLDLARVCMAAYPKGHHRIHPATRTFQALRIAVNDELGELGRVLDAVPRVMAVGGRVAIISFHSLEDRMVKQRFREWSEARLGRILTKKPMTADEAEARDNPRSRSAKLRGFEWGVCDTPKGKRWERE